MPPPRRIVKRNLADLRPHPRQAELFADLSQVELDALADDLNRNGLQHPIEILPNGTIVCGHQRVRAAELLGWEKIDVIVRHDLESQRPEAVDRHLIADNLRRRHLSPLAKARCIQALHEIRRAERNPLSPEVIGDQREVMSEELGMTPRNANRYQAALRTPSEVQNAFDRGEISLELAAKVDTLSAEQQGQITERIVGGEKPRTVIEAVLSGVERRPCQSPLRASRFYSRLQRWLHQIQAFSATASAENPGEHRIQLIDEIVVALQRLRGGNQQDPAIRAEPRGTGRRRSTRSTNRGAHRASRRPSE